MNKIDSNVILITIHSDNDRHKFIVHEFINIYLLPFNQLKWLREFFNFLDNLQVNVYKYNTHYSS